MTAAQLVAPGRFELVQLDKPVPGPGQVRVAVEGCGVCASNLPAWSGRPWFQYPLAPGELGHEGWGRVDAAGAGVDDRIVGRRVALISERAYAEADIADANDVIPLPEDLAIAPLEPFGCVFNVFERARIEPGAVVAVVGLGFIGLGVVRLAASAGARVLAVSRNAVARAHAERFDAVTAVELETRHQARDAVAELTAGGGCDTVIECTGHQGPLDLAGDVVAAGGRLVIAGYHQDGPRSVDLQQWNWKGIDVVNAHERSRLRIRDGMRRAADALTADPGWVDELLTHTLPLAEIGAALTQASVRDPRFVKAAVLTTEASP